MRPYLYSLSRAAGEYQRGRHEANFLNGNRNAVVTHTDKTDRLVRRSYDIRQCPDSIIDVHYHEFLKEGPFHAPASHHKLDFRPADIDPLCASDPSFRLNTCDAEHRRQQRGLTNPSRKNAREIAFLNREATTALTRHRAAPRN